MFAIALTDSVHNLMMQNVPSRVAGYLQKVSDFCVLSMFLHLSHAKLQFLKCDLKTSIFILVCKTGENTEYSFVKNHFVPELLLVFCLFYRRVSFFLCCPPAPLILNTGMCYIILCLSLCLEQGREE